jgi:mRNA export factor
VAYVIRGVFFLLDMFLHPLILCLYLNFQLKFWDTRTPNPVGVLELPERVCDLDVQGSLMVVATAGRLILTYNVGGPTPVEHSRKESPLKFQTRSVACFPDQTGYAVGGIEGRVGIQYVQKLPNKDHFAFKCHRQENNAYAVNCLAFQKEFGTFATVGSDGVVNFWDKDNKQRLKGFPPIQRPIPCAAFSAQGHLLAYASSYDWGRGSQYHQPGTPNEIFIHYTHAEEIQPKAKRR